MYQGKFQYQRKPVRRRRHVRRPSVLLLALVILMGALTGSTIAYLFDNSDAIVNTFKPSSVTTEITEEFDGNTKHDVVIKNTGDVTAYIRATYVVTWQNQDGEVHPSQPAAGTDYIITMGDGWFQGSDGYWYHTAEVSAQESTSVFIDTCAPVEGMAPENYYLSVEILASAIQSVPTNAVNEAWHAVMVQEVDGKPIEHGNLVKIGG